MKWVAGSDYSLRLLHIVANSKGTKKLVENLIAEVSVVLEGKEKETATKIPSFSSILCWKGDHGIPGLEVSKKNS